MIPIWLTISLCLFSFCVGWAVRGARARHLSPEVVEKFVETFYLEGGKVGKRAKERFDREEAESKKRVAE